MHDCFERAAVLVGLPRIVHTLVGFVASFGNRLPSREIPRKALGFASPPFGGFAFIEKRLTKNGAGVVPA